MFDHFNIILESVDTYFSFRKPFVIGLSITDMENPVLKTSFYKREP